MIQFNCGRYHKLFIKESTATKDTEESSVSELAGIDNSMAQEV
jgi:hypothetical protein